MNFYASVSCLQTTSYGLYPRCKGKHNLLSKFTGRFIDKTAVLIEEGCGLPDVSLRLLHGRHIQERCRDADMMGPVCDVISNEKPLTDTIREMRTIAAVHNETEITDEEVTELEEMLIEGDECCCDASCC